MPIRDSERARYPKDWPAISLRIRVRAEQRCECGGICGSEHPEGRCNAPNGLMVVREKGAPERWRLAMLGSEAVLAVRIILTVAHLDHTPEHCDEGNLLALCQRCHLRYDSPHHQRNAADTRRTKADAASGQVGLFGGRR